MAGNKGLVAAQEGGKHVTPAGKNAGNKGLIAAQNGGKNQFQNLKGGVNMMQPAQGRIIKYL
jgi:hypothetical protein